MLNADESAIGSSVPWSVLRGQIARLGHLLQSMLQSLYLELKPDDTTKEMLEFESLVE